MAQFASIPTLPALAVADGAVVPVPAFGAGSLAWSSVLVAVVMWTGSAWAKIGAATGAANLLTAEVNLGGFARGGQFTLAGTGLTVGKPVIVHLSRGPYTGKGPSNGEEGMYPGFTASGQVTATNQIAVRWSCPWRIGGNIKFDYMIGA